MKRFLFCFVLNLFYCTPVQSMENRDKHLLSLHRVVSFSSTSDLESSTSSIAAYFARSASCDSLHECRVPTGDTPPPTTTTPTNTSSRSLKRTFSENGINFNRNVIGCIVILPDTPERKRSQSLADVASCHFDIRRLVEAN